MAFASRSASLSLTIVLLTVTIAAAPKATKPKTRALPPKFPQVVKDTFFPNANEKLVGPRPDFGHANVPNTSSTPSSNEVATLPTGDGQWSKLISAETLEDEIKKLQKQINEAVTTPAKFKGGGFKTSRTLFTETALLFAIIAEYDADVRWKDKAAGVRDLMGRAGHNCKVGTDASFAEAKLRKEDLQLLIQGGSVSVPAAAAEPNFAKIADRPPLMQRLEQAQQQGIGPGTANSTEFNKQSNTLLHEAELIAAIAATIQKEGYEYADDDSYRQFATQMQNAAREIAEAVKLKNYDAARAASGNLEKSCSGCHEGFRS